ncbi:hypothetical protein CR513_53836, partial [Mucuna pruriens]
MESEERQKAWQSKSQKCVALSTTKAELGFVHDDQWLFYDSQSADMMTKVILRGKFEACCEIVGLIEQRHKENIETKIKREWIFTRQKREERKRKEKRLEVNDKNVVEATLEM